MKKLIGSAVIACLAIAVFVSTNKVSTSGSVNLENVFKVNSANAECNSDPFGFSNGACYPGGFCFFVSYPGNCVV